MERGRRDDGNIDDLPWASVFDPAANARAFSAIQAEGFRAASRLVDRFVRVAGTDVGASQPNPRTNGDRIGDVGSGDVERLIRSWWSMTGQFLRASSRVTGAKPHERAALDLTDTNAEGGVDLAIMGPGAVTAEVWLHNRGPVNRGEVRLRCSDLLAHDGSSISSAAVQLDPNVVPMPARCSRGVALTVTVTEGVNPATYRGSLLVEGHPDLWLPVRLTVSRSSA